MLSVCNGNLLMDFSDILQAYFMGHGSILRLWITSCLVLFPADARRSLKKREEAIPVMVSMLAPEGRNVYQYAVQCHYNAINFLQNLHNLMGALTFFVFLFNIFFLKVWPLDCGLSMWGKIMVPMYRLWLHGLYGLYGPRCPLSPKRPLNLITHSLTIDTP